MARPCAKLTPEPTNRQLTRAAPSPTLIPTVGSLLGCSLAAILLAGSGVGSQAVETTLQDDAALLHRSDAALRQSAAQIAELGADRVRITAGWSVIAPAPRSRTKPPAPFDADDSATYPRDSFQALDRAVRAVTAQGLAVQIDLAFWAPRWAVARPASNPARQRYRPNAQDFAAFSEAVARRYSGGFSDLRRGVTRLPAVRMYTTWNEPNHTSFLSPQWKKTRRGYRPYSPHVYRAMHEAAYAAIKDVDRRNTVLIGGLSSFGSHVPGRGAIPPLEFIRTMACVDDRLKRLRVPECRGAGTLRGDGLAMHPYSVDVAPGVHAEHPDDVYLADLGRLDSLLQSLSERGRISAAWPLYLTEYGYETKPPDPTAQYTPEQQARYVGWSTYLAQSDPHVKMFAQFLLRDIPASDSGFKPGSKRRWRDYQTGLLYADGTPKPSAQAFKIPLFASYSATPDGQPAVVLYGGVRPGSGRKIVRVERRRLGTDVWAPVQTLGGLSCEQGAPDFLTDENGFFRRAAAWDGPAEYRLGWAHGGGVEYGSVIPVDAQSLIAIAPPAGF